MESSTQTQENYIIKYRSPWFTTKFPKIFASIAFVVIGILFTVSIILFALSPSRDMKVFPKIIALTAVALPLVFFLFRFKSILNRVFPRKEIIYNECGMHQRLSDGSLLRISRIIVYKHLIKDISFINAFIDDKKSRFYLGYDSSYKLLCDRNKLLQIAKQHGVQVTEKKSFLLNYLYDI